MAFVADTDIGEEFRNGDHPGVGLPATVIKRLAKMKRGG